MYLSHGKMVTISHQFECKQTLWCHFQIALHDYIPYEYAQFFMKAYHYFSDLLLYLNCPNPVLGTWIHPFSAIFPPKSTNLFFFKFLKKNYKIFVIRLLFLNLIYLWKILILCCIEKNITFYLLILYPFGNQKFPLFLKNSFYALKNKPGNIFTKWKTRK